MLRGRERKHVEPYFSGICRRKRGIVQDTLDFFHKSLGFQSTWAFVLCVFLITGSTSGFIAYLVDKNYKKSLIPAPIPIGSRANLQMLHAALYLEGYIAKARIVVGNKGSQRTIEGGRVLAGIFVRPKAVLPEDEDKLFTEPLQSGIPLFKRIFDPLPIGDTIDFEIESDVIAPDDWIDLFEGRKVLYVIMKADFGDSNGWLYSESCRYYKAPDFSQHPGSCLGHDNYVRTSS
jgi:hypothetical protein